jgi:hypothetical protein
MTYVLLLTLDQSGPNWFVKVVKKSQAVDRNTTDKQKLSWHLTQNAYHGTVHSFRWLDEVPPDTFGPAQPTPAGKRFNMDDTNASPANTGTWGYELKIKVDNKIYSTTAPGMTAGVNDPTIKNK